MSGQRRVSAALVPEKELPVPIEWEARVLQDALKITQISSVLFPLFRFWSFPEIFPFFLLLCSIKYLWFFFSDEDMIENVVLTSKRLTEF